MKRLVGFAVLALALLAGSALADGGPGNLSIGVGARWGPGAGPGGPKPGVYGPWYLYWPLEAYFQTPAHPQYPFWPGPMVLPNGAPVAAPAMYPVPAGSQGCCR
jgi:hypothetical protein